LGSKGFDKFLLSGKVIMKLSEIALLIEKNILEETDNGNKPNLTIEQKRKILAVVMKESRGQENPKEIEKYINDCYWRMFG
jgi:hypothetical protein